jgi:ureidoglycolate hydrolase
VFIRNSTGVSVILAASVFRTVFFEKQSMYTPLGLQQVEEHGDCQPYASAAFIPYSHEIFLTFLEAVSTPGP